MKIYRYLTFYSIFLLFLNCFGDVKAPKYPDQESEKLWDSFAQNSPDILSLIAVYVENGLKNRVFFVLQDGRYGDFWLGKEARLFKRDKTYCVFKEKINRISCENNEFGDYLIYWSNGKIILSSGM
jgi:hypothetical protein